MVERVECKIGRVGLQGKDIEMEVGESDVMGS